MPTTSRFPWPQRTTAVAGVILLISALLLLLESIRAAVPLTTAIVIPLSGPAVHVAAAITRAVGFVVAAVGIRGEIGIAGESPIGRIALVVWGVRDLAFAALGLLPVELGFAGGGLTILFAVAALVAAVLVVRARVLSGFARWMLLPVAIIEGALESQSFLPLSVLMTIQTALLGVPLEFLAPALTALIAVSLLLWSRTEAVKHRAKALYDAW